MYGITLWLWPAGGSRREASGKHLSGLRGGQREALIGVTQLLHAAVSLFVLAWSIEGVHTRQPTPRISFDARFSCAWTLSDLMLWRW